MVVCALHSKKPRDPDDQVKHQDVLYLITNYTFVASLHFMLDVVGACAGMSHITQLKRRCVALEDLFVEKCVEALERAQRWGLIFGKIPKKKKTAQGRNKRIVRTEWLTQWGSLAQKKKNRKAPQKKNKRGRAKKSRKKN